MLSDCLNTTTMDNFYESACCSSYATAGYFNFNTQNIHGNKLKIKCDSLISNSKYKCPFDTKNLPYLPLSNYLLNDNCNIIEMKKEENLFLNSVFDCKILPICEISCGGGPDKLIINNVTKSCSCMTEWFLNSYFIQSVMAIIIYLMLNISRVFICKGLVRIVWRSLIKEEFEIKTSCTRSGKINLLSVKDKETTKINNVKNNGNNGKNYYDEEEEISNFDRNKNRNENKNYSLNNYERRDNTSKNKLNANDLEYNSDDNERDNQMKMINNGIEKMIWWYTCKGYFFVIFGVLLNFGWLLTVMQLKQQIVYKPS